MVALVAMLLISCSKQDDIPVTNIDQLVGTWKWESTCGGFVNSCGYSSMIHFQEVAFYANGQYVHKKNGSIDFTAGYTLEKITDNTGTLVLNIDTAIYTEYYSTRLERTIHVENNKLFIYRGELSDSYAKIR